MGGGDALLLAPTAGGKTEAAIFSDPHPDVAADWVGLSSFICVR